MHERDAFSEKIRQKLDRHEMPVDADLWKGIEKRIAPPKRVVPSWLYVSVSIAAGLALLFSVGNFFYLRDAVIPVSEEIVQHQQEAQQFAVIPEQPTRRSQDKHAAKTAKPTKISIDDTEVHESIDIPIVIIHPKDKEHSGVNAEEVKPTSQTQVTSEKKINKLTLPESTRADWTDIAPKKKKDKILLAAAMGSGVASSSATITPRSRAYRGESLVDLSTNFSSVLTPNDFRHKEYLPPVSAGLSIRMPLGERIAMESGLSYTYLLTRLSGSTTGDYRAEVTLHYLGVPVNFVYSFLKEQKWEIYASAGAMLEKGLRTDYKQYQNWDGVQVTTTGNTSVDGVQWSLNGALGVGYTLYKNMSLFFDPQISYYFDNGQPFSIRKEMPLLVSLNAGLRMSF